MLQSKCLSIGLTGVACVAVSSCAYVNHSKGMVVTDSSLKGRKPAWIHSVTLYDVPVEIHLDPGTAESNLLVGPCILLPLAVLPNPFGIYSALRKRKDWKIPDKSFRVRLDFWRAGWDYNARQVRANAEYKVRPQELRLRIGDTFLSPVSIKAHCSDSGTEIDCPPSIDGTYAFQVSGSTTSRAPQYEVTFATSAAAIERATLILAGISRNDQQLQMPAMEIARRRFFTVGCVLGEGAESYYFTR